VSTNKSATIDLERFAQPCAGGRNEKPPKDGGGNEGEYKERVERGGKEGEDKREGVMKITRRKRET
jgi:hypothetical protein